MVTFRSDIPLYLTLVIGVGVIIVTLILAFMGVL